MKILLDTHLLLWVVSEPHLLSRKARELIADDEHAIFFSSVSIWEMVIKRMLNRPDFRADPKAVREGLLTHGFLELTMTSAHALQVRELPPPLHKDPFDRLLLAQAASEGMFLATADATLGRTPFP